MDARPQRIRARGDENAPIGILPNKTLHQRNKSTPVLSAALQNGGLRNAAKRTAFGDVSNISNPVRASKDDSHVAGKNIPLAKPGISVQERKVLSQRAQRTTSVMGVKTMLNSTIIRSGDSAEKQPIGDSHHKSNTRKLLTKRSNVIFKNQLPSVVEVKPPSVESAASLTNHNLVERPSTTNAEKYVRKDDSSIQEHITSTETAEDDSDQVSSDAGQAVIRALVEKGQTDDGDVQHKDEAVPNPPKHAVVETSTSASSKDVRKYESYGPRDSLELVHGRSDHGAAPSEPEEYWDEDEDYNDDDDGYVTARSYRSRSDNTTGGAMTVLFPKYNQKAYREIALAKQFVESSRTSEDIEDELWDTSMVAEYGEEIFQYMREMEIKMLPNAHYMDNQAEIQWSMRSVLIDWLVQVHHRFSLLPETLFLSVNYIDRFLSCKIVSLGKLQLVGATAIFIAAKYEEINCPSIQEIVYMVDGGYTADEILKAERFMLSMLQFELGWPGPMSFLRRISKADDYDLDTRTLAKYFLEVTIMDERFVGSPPSFTSAGAHCLARMMLGKGDWSYAHVYYSNYTYAQLLPLLLVILECCENPSKHHNAIYDKYLDRRFKKSSSFVEAEIAKGFRLPETSF